jgi:hypothetical protein
VRAGAGVGFGSTLRSTTADGDTRGETVHGPLA